MAYQTVTTITSKLALIAAIALMASSPAFAQSTCSLMRDPFDAQLCWEQEKNAQNRAELDQVYRSYQMDQQHAADVWLYPDWRTRDGRW